LSKGARLTGAPFSVYGGIGCHSCFKLSVCTGRIR
jgi:hypothetical protein